MNLHALVLRSHRVIATLWLLFIAIALSLEAVGGPESPFVTIPIVVTLLGLIITGIYMLARPWVLRFRAHGLRTTN